VELSENEGVCLLKILVTGSIAFDFLMSFPGKFSDHFLPDKLDRISVSFLVDSLNQRKGGCAANIAYNLALLGERPLLMGSVGKDFASYRKDLENVGVDTSGTREFEKEYTASFFANTDQEGNQIASFYTGAMQFAKELSLRDFSRKDIGLAIISPNDPDAMIKYVRECREMKIPFIYDPGQQVVRLSGEELRRGAEGAKAVIVNAYELELFKKKTDWDHEDILRFSEAVVETRGEEGSVIQTREKNIEIPAVSPQQVLDPTGVGDAYRAGLMKGMIHGLSWEISGRIGSMAAAYVLETDGPQSHSYSTKEFVDRFCHYFGESEDVRRLFSAE